MPDQPVILTRAQLQGLRFTYDKDGHEARLAAAAAPTAKRALELIPETKLPCLDYHELRSRLHTALDYTPHPGQIDLHNATQRFKVVAAGARWGKSLAAAYEMLPYLYMHNQRGWIVGASYRLAEFEFRYMADAIRALGHEHYFKIRDRSPTGPSSITALSWKSEARVLTAKNPGNLMGEEVNWAILSEAAELKEEVWDRILQPRLLSRLGTAIIPSTPRGKNHWFFKLWSIALANPKDWYTAHGHAADNPANSPEEIERMRREMTAENFDQQVAGNFVSAEAILIPEFDPNRHVYDGLEKDMRFHWVETLGGVDFGYRNPTHALFGLRASDGTIAITREMVRKEDTSQLMLAAMENMGLREATSIFCDPSSTNHIAELFTAGFRAMPAGKKRVQWGIRQIRQRLLTKLDGDRPALIIDSSCKVLIEQLQNYVASGRIDAEGEPMPLKHNDHGVDALRYMLTGDEDYPPLPKVTGFGGFYKVHGDPRPPGASPYVYPRRC